LSPLVHAARCFAELISQSGRQHRAQIEPQTFDRRPAEEQVAVVDLVDTQPGFEYQRARDHRIVSGASAAVSKAAGNRLSGNAAAQTHNVELLRQGLLPWGAIEARRLNASYWTIVSVDT
jgi:hypothetical protein